MKEALGWIVGLVIAFVIIVGFAVFGLHFDRWAMPFAEETRRQTFEHSIAREQGVEQQIAGYCVNMRTAKSLADKKAFAQFIQSEAATYEGPLSADALSCVSEAKTAIATSL